MRGKVWGGLILIASSLSIALNIYTLLKQEEKLHLNYDAPAKPISYVEDKVKKENKEDLSNFVKSEFEEVKNLKLGRIDPFLPLVKEEEISKEKSEIVVSQPKKVVYVKKIEKKEEVKEPPYYLRGILEDSRKALVILESKEKDESFVGGEGDRVGDYKIEKIDTMGRKIILKDSKGKIFNIKM